MTMQQVGVKAVIEGLQAFLSGSKQMDTAVGKIGSTATTTGSQMKAGFNMGVGALGALAAAAVAAAGAAGLGAVISTAAQFEKTMSGVKAVSGATADELKKLSDLALQLGKDTSFSAAEAGKGIEELVKGGVSIADILGGAAAASLNLAAAGELSVADAAEIAANAMSIFGLKGSDMAHVADQIAGAANASSLEVSDFKLSLAAVGAVAATVGLDFDSTAQAIAVMGAAGIKGSDAGTSLKTMLLNLQPQTKAQSNLFRELGIITATGANQFFDAAGKAKSLADIAQVLQNALKGETDQQRLANLQILFGTDAVRAAAIVSKAGAAGFNEMAASMGKVTAAAVAKDKLDNFSGSMEQLKGSVETAVITLGTAFLPMLKGAADKMTDLVNAAVPLIENAMPRIIDGLKLVGDFALAAWDALKPGRDLLAELASIVRSLVIPAFQEFKDDDFGAAFTDVTAAAKISWELLKADFADGVQFAKDHHNEWLDALQAWGDAASQWVADATPIMMANLDTLFTDLTNWVTEHGPDVAAAFGEWIPQAVAWVAEAAVKLAFELPQITNAIAKFVIDHAGEVLEMNKKIGEALVKGIIAGLGDVGQQLWNAISGPLQSVIDRVRSALTSMDPTHGGTVAVGVGALSGSGTHFGAQTAFHNGVELGGPISPESERALAAADAKLKQDAADAAAAADAVVTNARDALNISGRAAYNFAEMAAAAARSAAQAMADAVQAAAMPTLNRQAADTDSGARARAAAASFAGAATSGASLSSLGAAFTDALSNGGRLDDVFQQVFGGAVAGLLERIGIHIAPHSGQQLMTAIEQALGLAVGGVESFGSGGMVGGPPGAPRLIMAHGGEQVVPRRPDLVMLPPSTSPGGSVDRSVTYTVNANYSRPETPQSIRYELETLRMLAGR